LTLLNLPDERSISFKKFVTPDEPDEIIPLWNTGVANTALFMTGGSWYGNIHTHPIGYYSMFSWVDLKNTRDLYRDASANKKASVFSMIVCHNNEVYSLKVDNFLTLDIAIDLDFNNPAYNGFTDKQKYDELDKMMRKLFSSDQDLERAFLKRFGNYGLSLYKANASLTNWSKLTLDNSANPIVISTPCN